MALLSGLLGVMGWAFFSFWTSIPAGVALGLPAAAVGLAACLSYSLGATLTVLAGQPVRAWVLKRFGGKSTSNPDSFIQRVWARYGLVGLALLAPITVGAQIGAILGLSFGARPRNVVIALSAGGAVWSLGLTLVVMLGLAVKH